LLHEYVFGVLYSALSVGFTFIPAMAIHRHPSLITLHSACDDPNGGRRPAQIPQLDTSH